MPELARLVATPPERDDDASEPPASAWEELAALVCTMLAVRPRAIPNLSLWEIRRPPART